MKTDDLVLAIVGSGGEGVASAGEILVRAAAHEGLYSMLVKTYGPQIRGGESMAQIRLSTSPVRSQGDALTALVVLSWANFSRFLEDVFLDKNAIIFHDAADTPPNHLPFPDSVTFHPVPFAEAAKQTTGNTLAKNILALGYVCGWFGLPEAGFGQAIRERFSKKSGDVLLGNLKAFQAGKEMAENSDKKSPKNWQVDQKEPMLILTGNEAVSLAALYAGVKFYSGYPITPASEIMECMARELPKFNGAFVQTEDEIAAITMAIGASFGGAKAMTATSGPGLSLMTEAIGLAAMAELPVVIVNVQRGGPSTGIPTKTSQSDLLQAVFGGHGNLPRVVLAPVDMADAIEITIHAFYLSEKYQVPVLILSDQFLGQRLEAIPEINFNKFRKKIINRRLPSDDDLRDFHRFKFIEDGISPISFPGIKNGMYTAAGIEHDEKGKPTSSTELHEKMTAKRRRKLQKILDQEESLLWRYGDEKPEIGILTWGSNKGVVQETIDQLRDDGYKIAALVPRQLDPLPAGLIQHFVNRLEHLLMVELADGQFYTLIKGQIQLPGNTRVLQRAGASPFTVHEIKHALAEVNQRWNSKVTAQKSIEVI